VPRASIEGTQIPEHLVRRYAQRGSPEVVFERHRRREGLMLVRTVRYFGFLLDRETEPVTGPFPADLAPLARAALVRAVLAAETPHPNQGKVRRSLERLAEYWRRSGGTLAVAAPGELERRLTEQLARVRSWDDFIATPITLDADALVPAAVRATLEGLPDSIHLYGDRVPIEYEIEDGRGVVRLRLKEGQARRLQPRDLPVLDRPIRFLVVRGKRSAAHAESLEDLRRQLTGLPRAERARLARRGRRPRRR